MYRFNEKQMKDFIRHIAGSAALLMEANLNEPENRKPKPATGVTYEELQDALAAAPPFPFEDDLPPAADIPPAPKPFTIYDYEYDDCAKRVEVMSRLCGRWETRGTRCDIEIERRGEHFILYYLKRNGARTEDRYVLLWNYGEVYYYCPVSRVTVLAFHTETDTLMISPGVDYTRVVEPAK